MSDNIGKLTYLIEVENEKANKAVDEFKNETAKTADVVEDTEKRTNKSFDGINAKALAVATAVGVAVVKMSKDVIKATGEIQTGKQNIVNATGATGENLESLMDSAKNVFATSEESFDEVSRAIGEINTRLGLTGIELESTTSNMLAFADVTGQDVQQAVISVTQAMNQWDMSTEQMPALLDKLTVAGQVSGVSVATLTSNLTDNAGTLQAMGYSMDEAISMMMSFEKQGIDSSAVLMGMKQSFAQSAKAGTNARADWENLLDSITNATDEATANSRAIDTFGNRIATTMVTALRNGKVSFNEFTDTLADSEGALIATDEAGKTTSDRLAEMKNKVTILLGEMGENLAPVVIDLADSLMELPLEDIVKALTPIIQAIGNLAKTLLPPIVKLIKQLTPLVSGLLNVVSEVLEIALSGVSKLIGWIGDIFSFFKKGNEKIVKNAEDTNKKIISSASATETKVEILEEKKLTKQKTVNRQSVEETQKTEKEKTDIIEQAEDTQIDIVAETEEKKTDIVASEAKEQTVITLEELKKQEEAQKAHAKDLQLIYNGMSTDIGSAFRQMFKEIAENGKVSTDTLKTATASAFGSIGNMVYNLSKDLVEGEDAWKNLGKTALKALASIVRALAEEMTARAVLAIFQLRWASAAALTAGAVVAYAGAGAIDGYANSLAVGKDYVPYDEYPAKLHKGEMVLTKQEAENFRDLGGNYGLERALSPAMSLGGNGLLNSFNIQNQLNAVIEVDGTQLGVAVLKNLDNARPFVMG